MHPVLFEIPIPEFLQGLLPATLTVYSYGTLIALGAVLGYIYTIYRTKRELGIQPQQIRDLMLYVIIAAILGGKFFYYFEKPTYYFGNPANMLKFTSGGFVFYGSLIFVVPVMLWYFRKYKIPTMPILDIMAVTATLVHFFGRLGCFAAGCCHGVQYSGFMHVTFHDPLCKARPLGVGLHPTQLYSAGMLLTIGLFLSWFRFRKQFHGQVFMLYLILYAVGRSIIETVRGDGARGYVIEGILTHSQFISIFVIGAVIYFYIRLSKNPKYKIKPASH